VAGNGRRADAAAKPPLEVVAPILAVDSNVRRSGDFVPGHPWFRTPTSPGRGRAESTWPGTGVVPMRVRARSASNEARDCDSLSWVPLLLVVRSRRGRERASCRCGRETTTGSGGTHFGCRLERPSFRGLRPRAPVVSDSDVPSPRRFTRREADQRERPQPGPLKSRVASAKDHAATAQNSMTLASPCTPVRRWFSPACM
jgi:hypothetical protein